MNSFITNNDPAIANKPKVYLNWILLDDQFNYVQSGSGAEQVPDESEFGTAPNNHVYQHVETNLPVTKNGYLYVYVSNETPNIDVFFDNLQVTHIHGQILEETHYYPFGLTMARISSKAASSLENKKKFIGQQLDDDLGLNWYQFRFRNHDPQLGRFIEIDPLSDKYPYNSTYAYAENRATSGIDLEGLEFWSTIWNVITDPGNAPGHIGSYMAQKQSEYSESVRATARLSTGTSGEVNHPGGSSPVEQGLTKTIGTLQDINSASQPYVDVMETTNTLASLTPIGEAGATTEAVFGTKMLAVEQQSVGDATVIIKNKPGFLVDQSGQTFPVPKNAEGPVPIINKNGNVTGSAFTGGRDGANGNVTSVRVMNPNSKNPEGYVKYYNDAQPKQGVNPYTGKTLPNDQNHFQLNLWWTK